MSHNNSASSLTRRQFLRLLGLLSAGGVLSACGVPAAAPTATPDPTATSTSTLTPSPTNTLAPGETPSPAPTATSRPPDPTATLQPAYLSVARGPDPATITRRAIVALGGIERFVASGNDVIIKPNICTDYYAPEYAATTNPTVIATLVQLCLGAGARRVRVMDAPFGGTAESAYSRSGIAEAVQAAGGEMEIMNRNKFREFEIPEGRDLQKWTFYQPIMAADVLINVPIAKHHNLARLTLGGKNLLGVITNPGRMHANLGQRIADLTSAVRPALTVVDAVRILVENGPTGGSLDYVRQMNTVIASHDIVAADAYAATLFDVQGADIGYIKAAAEMGLGTLDLDAIHIEEITT